MSRSASIVLTGSTLALIGLTLLAVGLYNRVRHATADVVWTVPVAEAVSPDGAWMAVADETTVDGMIATVIDTNVRLTSTKDPTQIVNILAVDTGGRAEDRPRISWVAPAVLQITVAGRSYLTVYKLEYDGVRIDLRYDPDDAESRTRWLQQFDFSRDGTPLKPRVGAPEPLLRPRE
jgi:hypothetical protein